jgi:hypothetical protein
LGNIDETTMDAKWLKHIQQVAPGIPIGNNDEKNLMPGWHGTMPREAMLRLRNHDRAFYLPMRSA